jgi:hypothetical protein
LERFSGEPVDAERFIVFVRKLHVDNKEEGENELKTKFEVDNSSVVVEIGFLFCKRGATS